MQKWRLGMQPNINNLLYHPLCEGLPVLNPLAFTHVPPDVANTKLYKDSDIWKFCLALCLQNVCFIPVKKLATLGYVVGVLFQRKLQLIF
jgi:hypothetical protein